MFRRWMVGGRSKIAEKMSVHMILMGDYKSSLAQELHNNPLWKRKSRLSRRRIRWFHYVLCTADNATLLSFTVALGRLIWIDNLEAKRRKFVKKLSEKIRRRRIKKKKRRGKPGTLRTRWRLNMVRKWKGWQENVTVMRIVRGIHLRPVLWSKLRMVVKRKVTKPTKVERQHVKLDQSSRMYRLAMAMKFVSLRNVYITTEWEFWAICFVQEVCGFWGSIAFKESLSDSLISYAKKFGLYVVSSEHLERMESCYECSSSFAFVGIPSWFLGSSSFMTSQLYLYPVELYACCRIVERSRDCKSKTFFRNFRLDIF